MTDPYRLPEPCIVGCSGGRTSGYLLRKVLDAYDGSLPNGIRAVFANTGKEREETLAFVERISLEWDVPVTWLEYRSEYPGHGYAVVNYATASRNGEPFEAMIEHKRRYREAKGLPPVLPNPAQRMCTGQLKMRTIARFAKATWGLARGNYNVTIALRAEEENRLAASKEQDHEAGRPYYPLEEAGVTKTDVLAFWRKQPFDLSIRSYQGNCDLCYMKSRGAIDRLIREEPDRAAWWIKQERQTGQRFRDDRARYSGLLYMAKNQPRLFEEPPDELESVITCEGGYCSD